MKKAKITKFKTLAKERESIEYLTKKKQEIEHQVEINQVLKKYAIRDIQDIDSIPANSDKTLLTHDANETNISFDFSYNFHVHSMLLKAPTKLVEIEHKNIKQSKLKIVMLESSSVEEINCLNIAEPTKEQLNNIPYSPLLYNNFMKNLSQEDVQVNLYYIGEICKFVAGVINEYLRNLTKEQVQAHYQSNIDKLNEELEKINDLINKEVLRYKGQPTYKSVLSGTKGNQKGKILELNGKKEETDLLEDLVYEDTTLSDDEKKEILQNIKIENLEYEIDRWLGKKLNKHERRTLRVLRRIIYQMIDSEEITGSGKSCYEAEIPLATIYNEYGLIPRAGGGYQHNQTKLIQNSLFGLSSSGLHKDILFSHNGIQKTRYILQAQEITQKVIIKKKKGEEKEPREVKQRIGIRIVVPSFLFVSNLSLKNYYHQDTEGLKRFMSIKGMGNSNAAFNIVEFFELHLSSPKQMIPFNLSKLITEAELESRYKTNKQEVTRSLKTIFDNMIDANFLIKNWKIEKGKYDQDKYVFENARYEPFTHNKKIAEVRSLKGIKK